ncbi:F-box protein At5g49610 isoform X2 [Lolium perenne]|uniref:F-box protein At5g49610 isoform X2 n=1 Tax=Lolium perenne TaxID=4522 RepID=UPI0021F56351|nr:F-box protein At5g49610-like isoform X2 [Lolium perenne]
MAKAPRTGGATLPTRGLPEEIIFWEILTRLPPRSLLRCRAVCRDWRRGTSSRDFLLVHHGRQPRLPVVCSSGYGDDRHQCFFAFDHRAADARLQPVAHLEDSSCLEACCDGLLILSNHGASGTCYSVSNMATRQHAPLRQLSDFDLLGMYLHRATDEYRLLLQRTLIDPLPEGQVGCYIFALGSDQPPRYIGGPVAAESTYLHTPALVRDSLHWFPVHRQSDPQQYHAGSKVVIVFDTTSESFREMRAPDVPGRSYIFEMDATLGIYSLDKAMQTVYIWVLQNYESEVWEWAYSIKLPAAEIERRFRWLDHNWTASVVSVEGEVLLLVVAQLLELWLPGVSWVLLTWPLRRKNKLVRQNIWSAYLVKFYTMESSWRSMERQFHAKLHL